MKIECLVTSVRKEVEKPFASQQTAFTKAEVPFKIIKPKMKWKEIIEEALEPQEEYEPWNGRGDFRASELLIAKKERERKKKPWRKSKKNEH